MREESQKAKVDVLLFDSGVGGLSILGELRQALMPLRYAYLADTAGLPYGNKAADWLLARVLGLLEEMLKHVEPQLIIIACNTASTLVLPQLRVKLRQPIVGVVPAIKPAAARSRSHVIGLLATPATITRSYTDGLIREFAAHCRVIRVGSSELVAEAERKLRGERVNRELLRKVCQPLLDPQLDALVLGCTHFPLLTDELREIFPERVSFVDSGAAIAQRVRQLLVLSEGETGGESSAYFTGSENAAVLVKILEKYGLKGPVHLPFEPPRPT